RSTLLDVLREHLDLTGSKKGCDQGQCGACTVLIEGRRVVSCLTLAVMQDGASITTIEGLAKDGKLHPLCSAIGGLNRMNAILGTSDDCIAVHPSDMCVALAVLEAKVHVTGSRGEREISFADFHRLPGDT